MARYILKRILTGIIALFVLAAVTFFLVRLIPGSPFQSAATSSSVVEAVEREYGLDRPLFEQFLSYMGKLLRGNFGISYSNPGVSVTEIIWRTWPVTASLGTAALVVSLLAGTGLGTLLAVSKSRGIQRIISGGAMLASGIPGFALAVILLLVFSVRLNWFPSSGLSSPLHYVLPVTALSLYPAAVITRLTGNALRAELQKEYVLFARAKGLGETRTLWTHAMKHACRPVLGYIGPASAFLLTGSFVVESIFTIPGIGREFVNSITGRDYTLILGLTVFMGTVVIVVNLIADLLGAWLDPEMRRAYRES